jgi:threonine/homoserine/homoserine lactone efflux protein
MDAITFYFLQGAALALSSAILPGPFQAFLFSRALQIGWKRTLPAALAPLVTDGPILALVLLVLTHTASWVLEALRIAGGLFILHLARGALHTLKEPPDLKPRTEGASSLLRGIAINGLNPNPWIFWSVVGGPLVLTGWRGSPLAGSAFLIGFFGVLILCTCTLVFLFAGAGRLNPRVTRILNLFALGVLTAFGLYQIARGLSFWL